MAYWGVFDQSAKQVARFDYADRKQAEQEAAKLEEKKKSKFFVQPVKETIEIDLEETPQEQPAGETSERFDSQGPLAKSGLRVKRVAE